MNLVSILNNVLIAATVQTVSKFVSEEPASAQRTLRQALKLQWGIGLFLSGSLLFSAPVIAKDVLLDRELGPLLRICSVVVLCYAIYAVQVGSLNGRALFAKQA